VSKYKGILFFSVLFFSSLLCAQIKQERKPLIEIVTSLQEKYEYQFTYADDVIEGLFILAPKQHLTFKEIIRYLQKETGLVFQFLENKFIAIKPKDTSFFICGYIIDYETGEPLEAVTIVGNNNVYALSDSFGYFKLKVTSGKESIGVRHLGYQTHTKLSNSFPKNDCTNIFLVPQIESLSEVILRNFIIKGIDKAVDGTYTIDFSNFGILPGLIEADVLQTVQVLPGIQSVNETISNINIRGGTNDQNLLLWDGIRMYQTGHFFGLISIFNPSITTGASVIKNGTSVDYTNGVSGSIIMKTDNNISESFTGSIGSNLINLNGFADIPISKKSSLQVSGRKAISNFLESQTPTYSQYFDRITQNNDEINADENDEIKFDFYDTSFRWLYDISDKDQLRLNFLFANNELNFKNNTTNNSISKESSLSQSTIAEGLFYKRKWNDKFTTTLQLYETDYTLESANVDFALQQKIQQENKVSESSIKLNTWYKYNNQLSFLSGFEFIETGITNISNLNNQDVIVTDEILKISREYATYTQAKYTFDSKKTNIKVGARYNYFEKFNTHDVEHIIEPRFSVNHKLTKRLNIEVLGEFKHQNTFQIINFQNDFLGIESRRWFLSDNDEIPITKSKQLSVGFNYSNKGWLISTEGYIKEVDGITSQSQGFLNQYANKKVEGGYEVKGLEFLINKRLQKLSLWLSYTYANNEYTFNDFEEITFPNNLDITHSLVVGTSYSIGNFKISTGLNWHSGIPITKPVLGNEILEGKINYEKANSSRLDDYLRIDASVMYNFKLSEKIRINTGLSVWNLSNHKNTIASFYRIRNNTISQVSQNALAFTPNFTFRVEFK
jgi:hypothetical protein